MIIRTQPPNQIGGRRRRRRRRSAAMKNLACCEQRFSNNDHDSHSWLAAKFASLLLPGQTVCCCCEPTTGFMRQQVAEAGDLWRKRPPRPANTTSQASSGGQDSSSWLAGYCGKEFALHYSLPAYTHTTHKWLATSAKAQIYLSTFSPPHFISFSLLPQLSTFTLGASVVPASAAPLSLSPSMFVVAMV